MHFPVRVFSTFAWLAAAGSAFAQSGTLQVPSGPLQEQPVKPPAAAPRTPVHDAAGAADHKVPVAAPHRSRSTHKPDVAGAPLPFPVPPVPPPAPATEASAAASAAAAPPDPDRAKLPRFASLRSDDVNLRAGPGTRYRIEWVYKRRDLPVEIEREFDVWRWVRAPDGVQGWVHQATLMGRRSFIVEHADATLRSEPNDTASPVAILKVGVIGRIRTCEAASDWCHVQAGSYRGYLRRDQFWGALPGEAISP